MSKKRPSAKEVKDTLNAFIFTADDMEIEWGDAILSRQGLEGKDRELPTSSRSRVESIGNESEEPKQPGAPSLPTPVSRGSSPNVGE